ncbi:unnamed protein product [Cyprideis torosa]|uniref:Uncharacterized protein n=1 Tax=Cyprideis torosa TaxID=163714 RepID=A0A7R8W6A9_9CRUS|nr:unnamed protein product [Cyprideis torosa]CAG0881563.1 unnamed protein product [Cyprideis torosa]
MPRNSGFARGKSIPNFVKGNLDLEDAFEPSLGVQIAWRSRSGSEDIEFGVLSEHPEIVVPLVEKRLEHKLFSLQWGLSSNGPGPLTAKEGNEKLKCKENGLEDVWFEKV